MTLLPVVMVIDGLLVVQFVVPYDVLLYVQLVDVVAVAGVPTPAAPCAPWAP
jgi:hypothetical protein